MSQKFESGQAAYLLDPITHKPVVLVTVMSFDSETRLYRIRYQIAGFENFWYHIVHQERLVSVTEMEKALKKTG